MSYTDKEMQVSTQIAYMNITQDQINEYLKDHICKKTRFRICYKWYIRRSRRTLYRRLKTKNALYQKCIFYFFVYMVS